MCKSVSCCFLAVMLFAGCNDNQSDEFVASGIVEGDAVKVSAQTPGLILAMQVDEGEEVVAGQTLAVIDTVKLHLQLQQIQAGMEEVGVQREITRNTLAKAEADFDNVDKRLKRIKELFEKGSATQQNLDDVEAAHAAAVAQVRNVRQNLNVIESKEKGLRAQRDLVRKQIADATVVAPISGTVTEKFYDSGETVPPAMPLVEMIDLREVWVKVYVSEQLLSQFELGSQVEIRVDGLTETVPGRVSWVSPKAEFTPKNILTDESRTAMVYAIKVRADNTRGILKHGMPVVVRLPLT